MGLRTGTASAATVGLVLAVTLVAPATAATPGPQPRLGTTIVQPASSTASSSAARPITRLIVRTAAGSALSPALRSVTASAAGVRSVAPLRRTATGSTVLTLSAPISLDRAWQVSRSLTARGDVVYAEPDIWLTPDTVSPVVPNDPGFASQWAVWDSAAAARGGYSSKAPDAWKRTRGSSSVVVAVIDTGITSHPDLAGRTVPGYDFVTDPAQANDGTGRDADPSDPGDWVSEDESLGSATEFTGCRAEDSSWHGTHVAGIIAATQGNALGISGVAPGVLVQPVRALGKCGGLLSDIADAVVWASGGTVSGAPANATPAAVINMSLGGTGICGINGFGTMQEAVTSARSRGTAVVVAAGNEGRTIDDTGLVGSGSVPANCTGVITVAASNRAGNLASYSNFGTTPGTIALSAQGGDAGDAVLSTLNSGTTRPAAPSYARYAGTSMATPHVAAAAALLQSLRVGRSAYTPDQVRDALQTLTQPFPGTAGCTSTRCGAGILDLSKPLPTFVPLPARDVVAEAGDTSAVVSWLPPTDAGGLPVSYDVELQTGAGAFVPVATTTSTSYTATGLTDGETYTLRVTAKNSQGPSDGGPVAAAAVVPTATAVPWAPATVTVVGGAERLSVTWSGPASDSPAVTSYAVRYRLVGAGSWECATAPGVDPCPAVAGTSRVITSWPTAFPAGRYEVEVAAANAQGTGSFSRPATATVAALSQTASVSTGTLRPYRDGYQDTTTISVRSNAAATGRVQVLSPSGSVVRVWPLASATAWSIAWNGLDHRGRRVANGRYHVQVLLSGRTSAWAQIALISVVVAPSSASRPSVALSTTSVYPARDHFRDSIAIRTSAGVPTTMTWSVRRAGRTVWLARFSRRGTAVGSFTGRDSRGRLLPAGSYTLTVSAAGGEGRATSTWRAITVSPKRLHSLAFSIAVGATRAAPTAVSGPLAGDGSGGLIIDNGGIVAFAPVLPASVVAPTSVVVHTCSLNGGATDSVRLSFRYLRAPSAYTGAGVLFGNAPGYCWSPRFVAPATSFYSGRTHFALRNQAQASPVGEWQVSEFRISGVRYYLS